MPKQGQVFGIEDGRFDTLFFDSDEVDYNYSARAPRAAVLEAGSEAASEAAPIWYITRTSKTSPYKTEHASVAYDQILDDRTTITSYA